MAKKKTEKRQRRKTAGECLTLPAPITQPDELRERHLGGLGRYTSAAHGMDLGKERHLTFDLLLAGAVVAGTCSVDAHRVFEIFTQAMFPAIVEGIKEMSLSGVSDAELNAMFRQHGLEQAEGAAPLTNYAKALAYIMGHLPAKFDGALLELLHEAAEFARREDELARHEARAIWTPPSQISAPKKLRPFAGG